MTFDGNFIDKLTSKQKEDFLFSYTERLLKEEDDKISLMGNISAILKECLEEINWAGFYLVLNGKLKLGPFQGLPATTTIEKGRGVCGACRENGETQLVPDVSKLKDHIACDASSKSEIALPIIKNGQVQAILDIDSPRLNRFTKEDKRLLEKYTELISDCL